MRMLSFLLADGCGGILPPCIYHTSANVMHWLWCNAIIVVWNPPGDVSVWLQELFKYHIKYTSFNVCLNYIVGNFKETLWDSIQKYLPHTLKDKVLCKVDILSLLSVNTLRPRQNSTILQKAFSNAFSWMKMCKFRLKLHWSVFPRAQLTILQHWIR